MGMRSLGGVHDRLSYEGWPNAAGLAMEAGLPLATTYGYLTALVARRRGNEVAGAD